MILDTIVAHKREEVAERQAALPLAVLRAAVADAWPVRDFAAALSQSGVSVIGELKKASPSKGLLKPDFDPVALAEVYSHNGVRAISILTDERFFQGSLHFLRGVRAAQAEGALPPLPLLRKDFIIAPYQVWEARVHGADAILLIAAVLGHAEMAEMIALADGLGMSALVEVHSEAEMESAAAVGARIIGVNNRDLRDFSVDLNLCVRLRPLAPPGTIFVAESGIHTRADVERLAAAGVDAILVGEALMLADDVAAKARELSGRRPSAKPPVGTTDD